MEGAIRISTDNLVRAGMPLVQEIVHNWAQWRERRARQLMSPVAPNWVEPAAAKKGCMPR